MSVRIRDVNQPGSRHRKRPGCFALVLLPTGAIALAAMTIRRKR
jgi:hypothetical protein